jgi:hypothetical protein
MNDEPQMKLKHLLSAFLFGLLMWWALIELAFWAGAI